MNIENIKAYDMLWADFYSRVVNKYYYENVKLPQLMKELHNGVITYKEYKQAVKKK